MTNRAKRVYLVLKVCNKHAKLCAPVSDVVDTQHFVASKLEDTGDGLSNDRRTKVANVHFYDQVSLTT